MIQKIIQMPNPDFYSQGMRCTLRPVVGGPLTLGRTRLAAASTWAVGDQQLQPPSSDPHHPVQKKLQQQKKQREELFFNIGVPFMNLGRS